MLHDTLNNGSVAYIPNDFQTCAQQIHHIPTAIFIGTGGNLAIIGGNSTSLNPSTTPAIFKNIPSGTLLPIGATKIMNTGTTASDIVVLYRTDK